MPRENGKNIKALKAFADAKNYKAVVILCFPGNGQFAILSYGKNKGLCRAAKVLNNRLADSISDGEILIPKLLY